METKYLNTMFPLPILLCAEYSVKLKMYIGLSINNLKNRMYMVTQMGTMATCLINVVIVESNKDLGNIILL